MNKKFFIALLCVPLLLSATSCGKKKNQKDSESQEGNSETLSIDDSEVLDYMSNLKETSKGNHFYYHYLRSTTQSNLTPCPSFGRYGQTQTSQLLYSADVVVLLR